MTCKAEGQERSPDRNVSLVLPLLTIFSGTLIASVGFRLLENSVAAFISIPVTWVLAGVLCAFLVTAVAYFILRNYRSMYRGVAEEDDRKKQALEELNSSLEERIRECTFELDILHDLSREIGNTLDYDRLSRLLLDFLHRAIPCDIAVIFLWPGDDASDLYVEPELAADSETMVSVLGHISEGLSRVGKKMPDPGRVKIRTRDREDVPDTVSAGSRPASVLQAPIFSTRDGEVIGWIFAGAQRTDAYSEEHTRLFHTIVNHASTSVQHLRAVSAVEQQYLETLVKRFPEGVILLDARGHIILANPLAEEYLAILTDGERSHALTALGEYSIEKLLGPPPEGVPYHEIEMKDLLRRVLEAEAHPMELGPMKNGWLLVLREVTREREVQQRAQQQEQLAAVGQLASGIAHDFNNLLMGMIGFGQLLQLRPGMTEEAKTDLERIVELGQRAAHLVRQILDFSRASITRRSPFDLALFIKETTKFLQRTIQENISIKLEIPPGDYLINADPAQIRQVVTNLALNSRDAMLDGGELHIKLSRLALAPGDSKPLPDLHPGNWLILSVSDTGTGIKPEVMPHIFKPFFTTRQVGKGTGLGMAQAYGIIKQHDGLIDVWSQEGIGTSISIYLQGIDNSEPARQDVSRVIRGHGETILLVEDEQEVLEMEKQMLESLGYRVVAASNGDKALALYESHINEIALVITDMVMPEMGGMELVRELREKNPAIIVVMLTGYPLESDSDKVSPRESVSWVQKPVNVSQMALVVSEAIKNRSSAGVQHRDTNNE